MYEDSSMDLNGSYDISEEDNKVEALSYKNILSSVGKVISFDISVNSTGWFIYDNGECKYGTYKLKSKDPQGRRIEFRDFLHVTINSQKFDFVVIEDVIAGNNFKTTQSLIQLNTIVDDMMFYGVINKSPIVRIGNTIWKRYLRQIGERNVDIKGMKDKDEIKLHVNKLGFCEDVEQDVYDALGMLLGVIAEKQGVVQKHERKTNRIENNILSYKVKVFDDEFEARKFANKIATNNNIKVKYLFDKDIDKSLKETVKKIVDEEGDDIVFFVDASIYKLGAVAIKFDISDGQTIVARNKNITIRKK